MAKTCRTLVAITCWLAFLAFWPSFAGAALQSHYERPTTNSGPYKQRVVVFVHGIFGDADRTWRYSPTVYWPKLLLNDPTFRDSDVYVASYSTPYLGNTMNVDEVVINLNNRMVNDGVFSNHREVVFVCHSLGGLVIQRLLLTFRDYARQVSFIYFFSTPETGAQIANLGAVFSSDPLLKAMFPGDENSYLHNLENEWKAARFHIRRFCAYEKKKYMGVQVVDRLSGTRNCDEPPIAINEDHLSIVKPSGMEHDSYIALRNAVKANPIAKRLPENKAVVHSKNTNSVSITEDSGSRKHDDAEVLSLDVVYDAPTQAFNFFNHGPKNVYLFGDKVGSGPRVIDNPRTITPNGAYHIWADTMAAEIKQKLAITSEVRTNLEVYVTTEDNKKHTITYLLWARIKDGALSIETQNLGVKEFEEEPPSFAVAVETKMMVPSPSKDVAGTGIWTFNRVGTACYLRSVDTAIFIRIKNVQATKVTITAYNLYGMGGELHRIRMDMSDPFMVLPTGVIPRNFQGGGSFQMPAPSGNAGGGFFEVLFKDADFSAAAMIQAQLLDPQVGEHYIEPGATVRGWAFFEYNSLTSMPVNLTMKISDDLGHTFSYRIPDEPGNPRGDTLQRMLNFGPAVDLSSCIRQPHPGPSQ